MDKPELIIPVRFDYKNAAQELKKVEQGRRQIGDTIAEGFQGASNAAKSFGSEIRNLIHPQADLGALNQAAGVFSDPFQQTLDYIKGVSQEFTELHRALHQVAVLNGRGDTGESTHAEVEAATSGLNPNERRKAQEEFQARADIHREGSQAGLSQQQLQTYPPQVVEFAKARGIAPAEAMAMGGNLLQFSEVPQDVNQLLNHCGRVLLNHDTGTGGFERLNDSALETAPDVVEQPIRKNRDGAAGRSVQERPHSAQGKAKQGYQFRTMEQLHLEAERRLMEGGRLTELDWNPGAGELMPGVANSLGQVVNFRAQSEVRSRLGESMAPGGEAASLGTVAMTARLQNLLERIAHSNERMARQSEDRPLAAPPPNPPGRM